MGKFTGYLICTDCDGTLTYEPGKVSQENAEAIRYFQKEGGLFTLATGRFPDHAKLFEGQFKVNAPIVSLNGAVIYDEKRDRIIKTWHMNRKKTLELLTYVNDNWKEAETYWVNTISKDGKFESAHFDSKEHKGEPKALARFMDSLDSEPLKILLFQNENITLKLQKDLKEKFGEDFIFDLSWPEGIEVNSAHSGKGAAVRYMKEHLGIDIHTTLGIGDYENDISLLECADIGYAVGNAIPYVKKIADRITVKNTENAIARIIMELGQL